MLLLEEGIMECGVMSRGNEALWELAYARERSGDCFSGYINGELVGCAGLDLYWQGVGELWMMLSPKGKKNPITTVKTVKTYLNMIIKDNELWRVQTTGRIDSPDACRLIEILGFEQTCLLKKYGSDKSDYFLYSMVI